MANFSSCLCTKKQLSQSAYICPDHLDYQPAGVAPAGAQLRVLLESAMSQTRILSFSVNELRAQVRAAFSASYRMPTLTEISDPHYHYGGKLRLTEQGHPDPANIDPSAIEPKVWLVQDPGTSLPYVMPNARPAYGEAGNLPPPAFAKETATPSDCRIARTSSAKSFCIALPTSVMLAAIRSGRQTVRFELASEEPTPFAKLKQRLLRLWDTDAVFATIVLPTHRTL